MKNVPSFILGSALALCLLSQPLHAGTNVNRQAQQQAEKEREAEKAFMRNCNKRGDELLAAMCGCVMESVKTKMPISQFSDINQKTQEGTLPLLKVKEFSDTLRSVRPALNYCLEGMSEVSE